MDDKTRAFIVSKFQEYYSQAQLTLPPEFTSREWGFIEFGSADDVFMKRHRDFGSEGELYDYLRGMAPAHAYYSVAYYEYPGAPKMKEKNWLKADLIFDIDSDHLPGKINSYGDMLEKGKKETLKLLDFLINDFGFDESAVHAVFSGGRGYHFHISDPSVLSLESPERREIVDYISGKISPEMHYSKEWMVGEHGSGTETFRGKTAVPYKYILRNNGAGWGKRIANYIVQYLISESTKPDKDMFRELRDLKGFGKSTSKRFQELKRISKSSAALQDIIKYGRLDFGPVDDFQDVIHQLISQAVDQSKVNFGNTQVDEPVTADIKRLIRLPGSLHGKSGMKVTALKMDELEGFEPLNDAVVFGDKSVKIKAIKPFAVQMKGKDLMVEEGVQEVPEYAAVYLICRGVAEYGSH
ncbi:DNA primase catalytic subunit PriS [Methanolobus chelungpuianus]|uniref:DNA primase small subunit PriS n=1 Tax=Methanolobus chelungpuianus TaxID=502115 RepID=A0AAE3KW05_9EURY|nr:DNA primase catalytic subunit PriS [Methanolobus chelungpuianus]MCQ6961971.1 DNA primase [Methanolobus chelungpuianus]